MHITMIGRKRANYREAGAAFGLTLMLVMLLGYFYFTA